MMSADDITLYAIALVLVAIMAPLAGYGFVRLVADYRPRPPHQHQSLT